MLRWPPALSLAIAALLTAMPEVSVQEKVIAYVIPAGTAGNQDFGGTRGMEFDVNNPVIITRLGVFDDNSDGLNLTISVQLYDRATDPPAVLASTDFTPGDPGELVGGSRFKTVEPPLRLEAGFQGTIVAEGYGANERLRNAGVGGAGVSWTTRDGDGSLAFVGTSRYGTLAGGYPDVADEGPAARYGAGTFEFQTTPRVLLPGKPVVSLKPGDQQIALSWPAVTEPAPAAKYQIMRGAAATGPFEQIAEVTEDNHVDSSLLNGTLYCYSVRGVTAEGLVGPESSPLCGTAGASPAQPVVITSNLSISETDTTYDGADLVIAGAVTVAINGPHLFNSVLLTNQAVLTHSPCTEARMYKLDLTVSDTIAVSADSRIDVTGCGYLPGRTAGNIAVGAASGNSGGSYGGLGGSHEGRANPVYGGLHRSQRLGQRRRLGTCQRRGIDAVAGRGGTDGRGAGGRRKRASFLAGRRRERGRDPGQGRAVGGFWLDPGTGKQRVGLGAGSWRCWRRRRPGGGLCAGLERV